MYMLCIIIVCMYVHVRSRLMSRGKKERETKGVHFVFNILTLRTVK